MAYQYTNAEIKEAVAGERVLTVKKMEFYDKITSLLDNGYQSDVAAAQAAVQPQLDAKDATIASLEAQIVALGETPVTQQ